MDKQEDRGIIEILDDIMSLAEERKRLLAEEKEYRKKLDAWWAEIDRRREERLKTKGENK